MDEIQRGNSIKTSNLIYMSGRKTAPARVLMWLYADKFSDMWSADVNVIFHCVNILLKLGCFKFYLDVSSGYEFVSFEWN